MTVTVAIVAGPNAGERLVLPPGAKAVIGRGADLSIEDANVSRRHVEIEHLPVGVFVREVSRRQLARLDGQPLPIAGRVIWAVRATLEIGAARLEIACAPPPGVAFEMRLGGGRSGEVWSAWQDPPGRRVAIKVLAPAAPEERLPERARREATLGARLDHPGLARVHELIDHAGRLFVVRELIDGVSLEEVLKKGPLAWPRAVALGAELADALAHAHERGVVHRDVKPGNVILERSGRARLVDFDLARDHERPSSSATNLTATEEGLGTIGYAAPEQLLHARGATPASDVYGLAALLYHALAGEPPFAKLAFNDYLRALFHSEPTPLEELAPHVPERVRRLVEAGLARDPAARPPVVAFRALEP